MSIKKFLDLTNETHNFDKITNDITYLDDVKQRIDVKEFLDVIKYEIILDIRNFDKIIYTFDSTINYYLRQPELYIFMEFFHNLNDLRPYHKMRLPWEIILSESKENLFDFMEFKNENNEWDRKFYYGIEFKIEATSEEKYITLYDFIEKIFYYENSRKIYVVDKPVSLKKHLFTKTFSIESNKLVGTHGILLSDNTYDGDLVEALVKVLNLKNENFNFKRNAANFSRSIQLKSNDSYLMFKFFKFEDCSIMKIFPEIFKKIEMKQKMLIKDIINYSIKLSSKRINMFCDDLKNNTQMYYKKNLKHTMTGETKITYEIDNEWDGIVRSLSYYNNKVFGQNIFFSKEFKNDKCFEDLYKFKDFLFAKIDLFFEKLTIN